MLLFVSLGFLCFSARVASAGLLRGNHRELDPTDCRAVGDYYRDDNGDTNCADNAYDCARRKVSWNTFMNDSIQYPDRAREIFKYLEDHDVTSGRTCLDNVLLNANGGWGDVYDYLNDMDIELADMVDYLNEEELDYGWLEDWVDEHPDECPPDMDCDDNNSNGYENPADRISHMTQKLASDYEKWPLPSEKLKISPPTLLIDMVYDCHSDSCTGNYVVSGNDPNHNGGFKDGFVPCGVLTEAGGQLAAYEYAIYLESVYTDKTVSNMCHYVHEGGGAECTCELDAGDVMYLTATYDHEHSDKQGKWGTFNYSVKGYVNGKKCFDDPDLAVVFKDLDGIADSNARTARTRNNI